MLCKFTFSVRATLQKITAGPTNFSLFCKLQEKFRWGFHHFILIIIIIIIIIIIVIIILLILFVYYFSFTFLRLLFFIVLTIKCAYVCTLQETSPLSRYTYQTVVWTAAHNCSIWLTHVIFFLEHPWKNGRLSRKTEEVRRRSLSFVCCFVSEYNIC